MTDLYSEEPSTPKSRRSNSITAAIGKEPSLNSSSSESEIIRAFNWYNYSCDANDAKKYVMTYLTKTFPKSASALQRSFTTINSHEIGVLGWMAKQKLNGNTLPSYYEQSFRERLEAIILKAKARHEEAINAEKADQQKKPQPKIMNSVASLIISELDSYIDEIENPSEDKNIFSWLSGLNPSPITMNSVRNYYLPYQEEIDLALNPKKAPEQIAEAYSKVSKTRIKKLAKFFEELFGTIDRVALNKKRTRKPRARKVKTAAQVTKKLKYKDYDDKYKIKSIQPTELVGCIQLWVFNTKTRKLGVYHADDTQPLSVKGSTIIGYNQSSSVQKTLRKPEDIISQVASGNKVQLRHVMSGIKAKSSPLNGRINAETILLRSVK